MKVSLTSGIKYTVNVSGGFISSHVQEREAVESALNAKLANPTAKVEIIPTGKTTVTASDVAPVPVPTPTPTPTPVPTPTPIPTPLPIPSVALKYVASYPTPTINGRRLNFGKHTKMAFCPLTGKIYTCGGDGFGPYWGGNDSGTMDTVGAYDVRTHTYTSDFLYAGHAGEPIPRGVDYAAFTWIPTLNEFWLGPGYGWDYGVDKYPWVETKWIQTNYASYNPLTKRFTDRGPKRASASYGEGFAGSWDAKRNRLVWAENQMFHAMPIPGDNSGIAEYLDINSHRVETADTWVDDETDTFYFVQLATGRVYGYHMGTKVLRKVADLLPAAIDGTASRPVVYLSDTKQVLVVYSEADAGPLPWKLVNLTTGEVEHMNLYAPGCNYHNTGCYDPQTQTIVLTGGGQPNNGAAFHEYKRGEN